MIDKTAGSVLIPKPLLRAPEGAEQNSIPLPGSLPFWGPELEQLDHITCSLNAPCSQSLTLFAILLQPHQGTARAEAGFEVTTVRSTRVVLDNTICPAEILINDGKIVSVLPGKSRTYASGEKVLDVGDLVVMPGIIDPHIHACEPGHTVLESYSSATKAAAAGGITTIVDMPMNCLPPTTTMANFDAKLKSARGQCHVDVAFWGGVIPGNQDELLLMLQAGVPGFKCFLTGCSDNEFPSVCLQDLHMVMNELEGTECVLLFHAEQDLGQWEPVAEDPAEYKSFLDSCPDAMEVDAIHTIADLCLQYKMPCHIVHLSSAQALPIIRKARQKGAPLTVETAHHYLTLTSEHIPPGGTYYKCRPPIRGKNNREQLWAALQEGLIDMVVSAHNPCPPDLKHLDEGDFFKAQGGISSLQFGLPLFWTSAKSRGFSLHDLVQLMCTRPAALSRLEDQKGSLRPGMDADLVIWDPDKEFEVKRNMIHHKNKLTPYLGFRLCGEVFATLVRGRLAYLKGKFSTKPQGDLLVTQRKTSIRITSPYY
ncbi:allantoinase, mitochondrial-like [Alligator sinensis]|uniref:allantoinase n=1 Tax=Alligator sinensis TaxID=38654 RepID=A0A3Q0GZF1_ALLSI|nr:allantoinase, mitochondrial-like [Alligator sinensis]